MTTETTAPPPIKTERRAAMLEIAGELILLSMVAAFFVYIVVSAMDWKLNAALTPLIAVTIGTPFLIWRVISVIRMWFRVQRDDVTPSQIMDIGFRIGVDRAAERARFIRIFVAIGVLYAGIWLVGFHITLPLWVLGYVYLYGKVRFVTAVFIAALFLAFMVGVYDLIVGAYWNDPFLLQLFR